MDVREDKPLPLFAALREVLPKVWRWLKREPWMFSPYIFVWWITTTVDERREHLDRLGLD